MDEGDEYVPNISQMDYALMDGGGSMGSNAYYDGGSGTAAMNSLQQMSSMYGDSSMPQQQMMAPSSAHHLQQMSQMSNMYGSTPSSAAQPPQPPAKPKSRSRKKATPSTAGNTKPSNSSAAYSAPGAPMQQPLPPSYQMMPGGPHMPQNPAMMAQARQQAQQRPSQQAGYPPYGNSFNPEQGWTPEMAAAYPGVQPSPHQQFRSGAAPGYPPGAGMPPMPQGYPGQAMRHPYYDQQQASAGFMGQYPPNSAQSAPQRYPSPAGQSAVPQQQQQSQQAQQPSAQQPYGYMDPNMAQYYSQYPNYPQPPNKPPAQPQQPSQMGHFPDQPSASGGMSGSQMMPQYPQGNAQMQRTPGQPPGWPPNYPSGPSTDGAYWTQQQQQQASQMAFQIQHKIAECERNLAMIYQQPQRPDSQHRIAQLQAYIQHLRSQMPPNAAQAMGGAAAPGSIKPSEHAHMPSSQYSPSIPSQGGPNMQSQQSPQMPVQRISTSDMARAEQKSAVAVMQTAANQVNITPEVPGRTLISVYHQYPSPNTSTNVSTATGIPMLVDSTTSASRDSVPPEPVPSARSNEKTPVTSPGFPKATTFPPSAAASTPVEAPFANAAPTTNTKQPTLVNSIATSSFTTTPTETNRFSTPPPPQPVPVSSARSSMDFAAAPSNTADGNSTVALSAQDFSTDFETSIGRDQKPVAIPSRQSSNLSLKLPSSEADTDSSAGLFSAEEPKQLVAETELVNFLEEHKIERVENVQHQRSEASPVPPTEQVATPAQAEPEKPQPFTLPESGPSEQMAAAIKTETADIATPLETNEDASGDDDAAPSESQVDDEPVTESQTPAEANEEESRPDAAEASVAQSMEESNISMKTEEEDTTAAPSISTENAEQPSTEDNEDGATDSKSALMDDTVPSAGDSAAEADSDYAEPKPKPKRKTAGGRGRKSTASSSAKRKRRKAVDDWDDDDNFVSESKKKSRKSEIAEEYQAALQEPGLEEFVEKRRSGRKKADKKSYDEDKPMDFEEEVEEELPNGDAEVVPEKKENEWVVERILGVRNVKKKIKRKKSSATANGIEVSENGESKPLVNGNSETEPHPEGDVVDKAENNAEVEPQPSTSAEGADEDLKPEPKVNGVQTEETSKEDEVDEVEEEVEEIYVKYKNRSYLHCAWKSVEELEADDKRIVGKINRFKQKYGTSMYDDEEYFNEDFVIVDRVLDESVDDETGDEYYFVKWRSLPYEECTWELVEDVPKDKIAEYRKRNKVDSYKTKERERPDSTEWKKIPEDKVYKDDNALRDYQFEGVNWLLFCYYNRQNCILADEMGLGKTVQSICFLQSIYDLGIHGPFLIVVPLSTLHNWEREFETWTDMNAVVYHGGAASREIIQRYEMYYPKNEKKKTVYKFDALITTFEMVVTDCEVLRKINYRVCIIDEAHRLKNRNCKLLTGGLLAFKMEHRVLLTGTPLQNNIQELFSLLNFLEPQQFGSSDSFLEQFGQCQTDEQVKKLQEILKPMMLRRLKEDVEKTLQPKEETIIEVQLSNIQKKYYRAILERNFTHLLKGTSAPNLMNAMMELRKCCNHPFLINGAEEQIISELRPLNHGKSEEELQQISLVQSSGKLVLIDKLLPKLRQDGHKVLIFSQMVKVLDLLEEFLIHHNYMFERIDGNVRGDLRQAAIDRFCKPDSERFVFLLCTRAGGLGINLTAADTVIIFDSDWNPQNDLQAQARCHRIGQTKMVKVYRLITANTYEREMFDRASLKLGLDKAVLQSSTAMKDSGNQLTRKEVEDLLKKGAYGAVMDEENEGSKFSEEDIETILQRRTQTIRIEPGIKGSTFAKASFKSSSNREDIDVNDPNFWAKWAKKANIEVNTVPEEIIHEPRSRRKRFEENYKGLNEGESEEGDGSDDESGEGKGRRGDKTRSAKKRRREDDDDYVSYNVPNEFAFNKSEFFKVEKQLTVWGWGRWNTIKENSELSLSETDMEHISRTLLLHCIREYRGDEKTREFVWRLITPKGGVIGKGGKKGVIGGGIYHEGWAALPEYNPPAFAVDSSFQRHVHRHATKLLTRVHHLQYLQKHIVGDREADILANEKPHKDVPLQVPTLGDPPLQKWDTECDKSFLFGIFKHGMDNFEAIRSDPLLCFIEKEIEEMPTTMELNTRLKRLIMLYQRQAELRASEALKISRWPKHEEVDFMRVLRVYGVKDDSNSANVINWTRFRELTTSLQKKTDAEMLEQLYCVLAMCTKQQGNELSQVDQRRAACVEAISAQKAEKLMNRLHLMRKIHAIITTGIHHVRTSLKLCSTEHMPSGWGELHDEQLLIIVDKWGLDRIAPRIGQLPAFEKVSTPDEKTLLRRVVEICTTLETGRWNGIASTEMIEDEETSLMDTMTPQSIAMLQKAVDAAAAAARGAQSRRGRRKNVNTGRGGASTSSVLSLGAAGGGLDLAEIEKEKMRALMHQSFLQKMEEALTTAALNPNSAASAAAAMNYMLPLMGLSSASTSSSSSQQQQQLQQLQALLTLTSLSAATGGTSGASLASVTDDVLNLSKKATTQKTAAGATATATVTATKPISCATPSTSASTSNPQLSPLNQLNIADLLALANLPVDTNIPVVNTESGQRLTGEKAPKLKHLEQWLKEHPKYKLDMVSISPVSASPKPSSASITKGRSALSNSLPTAATPSSATVSPKPPVKAESSDMPKSSATPKPRPSTSSTPAAAEGPAVGVFYRSTGIAHPADKWPTLGNLVVWLEKNPDSNVQTAHIALAKTVLPKSYHDRLGGDVISTAAASSGTSSTSVLTSTSSASQAATAAAAAAAFGNMSNMQNMEALQLQLLLQQAMFGQSLMAGYNPYAALLTPAATTSSSGSSSATNGTAAGMDAATLAALNALMGPQLAQQLTAASTPASKSSAASTSAATVSSSSASNAAAATANLLGMSSNEAAFAAELLANPSLLSMLNPSAAMSLNPMQAMTGIDMATLAQLSALTAAASTDTATLNSNSGTASGTTTATRKPAQAAKGLGKLNAVVEKLASTNSSSEQQQS